jgi:hypothetical protein
VPQRLVALDVFEHCLPFELVSHCVAAAAHNEGGVREPVAHNKGDSAIATAPRALMGRGMRRESGSEDAQLLGLLQCSRVAEVEHVENTCERRSGG